MMRIQRLDHVNIRTANLDIMVAWYENVLGLRVGARPSFQFPGAWLYAGNDALVHLVETQAPPGPREGSSRRDPTLQLEHFAFSASDGPAFEKHLQALDETYRRTDLTEINCYQINIWDPDGNHIHVDFPLDE